MLSEDDRFHLSENELQVSYKWDRIFIRDELVELQQHFCGRRSVHFIWESFPS